MPAVNYRIQTLVEHDMYRRWLGAELPNATICLNTPKSTTVTENYTMEGLWGVFVVLTSGLLIATLAFIVEMFCFPRIPNTGNNAVPTTMSLNINYYSENEPSHQRKYDHKTVIS
ncbi:unnamed protein product [Meganyctiphanes norvegica]|uniref:Uncharacterized protein n=1 Tax=Meganyctiphanes norvegica TaxID=48144 RepID=A0AAV2PYD8_MEGNR